MLEDIQLQQWWYNINTFKVIYLLDHLIKNVYIKYSNLEGKINFYRRQIKQTG